MNIPNDISIDDFSKEELTWFSQLLTIEGRIIIVRNLKVSKDSLFWIDQENKSLKKLSLKEIAEINYENSSSGFFSGLKSGALILGSLWKSPSFG
jgi:hypothetical protein